MARPATLLAILWLTGAAAAKPPAVRIALPDQFGKTRDTAAFRGDVVVLVYGDRSANETNQEVGKQLHLRYRNAARPAVRVVPVACVGKVPGVVQGVVSRMIRRASPEVPVWLDFKDAMKSQFGLADGKPNLIILDAAGRLRYRVNGKLDAARCAQVVTVIDGLRREAAGK